MDGSGQRRAGRAAGIIVALAGCASASSTGSPASADSSSSTPSLRERELELRVKELELQVRELELERDRLQAQGAAERHANDDFPEQPGKMSEDEFVLHHRAIQEAAKTQAAKSALLARYERLDKKAPSAATAYLVERLRDSAGVRKSEVLRSVEKRRRDYPESRWLAHLEASLRYITCTGSPKEILQVLDFADQPGFPLHQHRAEWRKFLEAWAKAEKRAAKLPWRMANEGEDKTFAHDEAKRTLTFQHTYGDGDVMSMARIRYKVHGLTAMAWDGEWAGCGIKVELTHLTKGKRHAVSFVVLSLLGPDGPTDETLLNFDESPEKTLSAYIPAYNVSTAKAWVIKF